MLFLIIGAYFLLATFLYRYFAKSDRGSKEPKGALRIACLFGVAAVVAAGYLNNLFVPKEVIVALDGENALRPSLDVLLRSGFIIGVIEETLKFLPLALFIYKKKYFNELTDGVIYFGLAGMWFGVVENVIYALNYGESVGLFRIFLTPFLHAGFSSLAGIGLIKYKLIKKTPIYIIVGLGTAIFLHATYNFFLFSQELPLILAALGIGLAVNLGPFRYFKRARMEDEKLGLSAIGNNKFCRNCGKPNPHGNLYCQYCGKKT